MPALRISVVMPSYQQGRYLGAAIESVLGQSGPEADVELIVMDGGSTDESVEVIRRYEDRLAHWQSEPDGGQSAAINAGFARATGDVLCWLNSDDYWLPGTLGRALDAIGTASSTLVYGHAVMMREQPDPSTWPALADPEAGAAMSYEHALVQPSSFWTRDVWERTGPLDTELTYAFDWDWYARAASVADYRFVPQFLSVYRVHDQHKTGTGGAARRRELLEVARRHAPADWVERYERLADVFDAHSGRIAALERRGMSAHRAALVAAASAGLVPKGPAEARRWVHVLRMYA